MFGFPLLLIKTNNKKSRTRKEKVVYDLHCRELWKVENLTVQITCPERYSDLWVPSSIHGLSLRPSGKTRFYFVPPGVWDCLRSLYCLSRCPIRSLKQRRRTPKLQMSTVHIERSVWEVPTPVREPPENLTSCRLSVVSYATRFL